ncbi:hypothetical protein IFR05_011272 [Cadophora sp. M221]|nr:hypothetical protein IFR05_011272 [Cadophora sp. M221]
MNRNYQYQPAHARWYQGQIAEYDTAAAQEPAYGVWSPHAHQERADDAAHLYQEDGEDDQPDYYGADYYSEPEVQEPENRCSRRHDGTKGPRLGAARSRNPYRPLLDILQPVTNGADMTMDMSLTAFNALFERKLGGYVPGMDFKDRTGASISGLKNLDGQNVTIVIKGSHTQVDNAYELLKGHDLRYRVEANANEDIHVPCHPRRRRR